MLHSGELSVCIIFHPVLFFLLSSHIRHELGFDMHLVMERIVRGEYLMDLNFNRK